MLQSSKHACMLPDEKEHDEAHPSATTNVDVKALPSAQHLQPQLPIIEEADEEQADHKYNKGATDEQPPGPEAKIQSLEADQLSVATVSDTSAEDGASTPGSALSLGHARSDPRLRFQLLALMTGRHQHSNQQMLHNALLMHRFN